MKTKINVLSCLLILLAGAFDLPLRAQQRNSAPNIVYQLDVKKSRLFWTTPRNNHKGFILFNSGTLSNYSKGRPTRGIFSINMNSVRSTGKASVSKNKEVDDELRSESFFAVSRYPTAIMVVNNIVPEPNRATFRVTGMLTIKGVTKPIEFTTLMKQNASTITASANMSISRAEWNINPQPKAPLFNVYNRMKDSLVDDKIPVSLELVFSKKSGR